MTPEGNKALVRRLFDDVINRGDLERADDLVSVGFVEHNPIPGQAAGLAGFKQVERWFHADVLGLRRQLGMPAPGQPPGRPREVRT